MPANPKPNDFPPTTLYRYARSAAQDGDIALFRNGGPIANTGYGDWTHAGLLHWNRNRHGRPTSLYVVQFREWRGCIMVPLRSEVRNQPACIDLFRPTCGPAIAWEAQELLCRQLGKRYGWSTIAQALFMRLTFLRLVTGWTPDRDNPLLSDWYDGKDCSQGVAWAFGTAKCSRDWDLIPNKSDKSTVPSDIGFTGSADMYARGLVLEQGQVAA